MFAVRHPKIRNLWFDFNACSWTFDLTKRTMFNTKEEADQWATLPTDGGKSVEINR